MESHNVNIFESKNLLNHINGTTISLPPPPSFPAPHLLTDEEEAKVEKAEDRLKKFLAREGLVKSQVNISVSEPLALMLQKRSLAQEVWSALVSEMTKKPKMVVNSLQRQLRNIKCSEEDNLRLHLDRAQDLFVRLKEMGAKISDDEFMDIILASLPPTYDAVMNALTTSLEECGRTMDPHSLIRILEAQYKKRKTAIVTQEDQAFMGTSTSTDKKQLICTNCKKSGHIIENCWAKGGGKEGQAPWQKKRKKAKPKKKKKGKAKANATEEVTSSDEDDEPIAFTNFDCATLPQATEILDTGVSSHMTPHLNLLQEYKNFLKARRLRAADKGTFKAYGTGTLVMPVKIKDKNVNVILRDTLYAPKIAFTLISIGKCNDAGYETMFAHQKCIIKDSSGKTLLVTPKFHGLYHLDRDINSHTACPCLPMEEIHKRLVHISTRSINHLLNNQMISGLEINPMDKSSSCKACIKSKMTHASPQRA